MEIADARDAVTVHTSSPAVDLLYTPADRGRIVTRPDDHSLVDLLIDEYVRFPTPSPH